MAVLFLASLLVCWTAESRGNPRLHALATLDGGNMEGKEARFGVFNSALVCHGDDLRLLRRRQLHA